MTQALISKVVEVTLFPVEGEVRAFQGNLFLWDGRLKSENIAAFRALLDFLDEDDRNEPLAGTPSRIT